MTWTAAGSFVSPLEKATFANRIDSMEAVWPTSSMPNNPLISWAALLIKSPDWSSKSKMLYRITHEILRGQVHRAEGAGLGDDIFVGFGDYDSEVGEPAHPALGSTADQDRATGESSGEGLCDPERLRGLSRAAGCQQEGASRGGKNGLREQHDLRRRDHCHAQP